MNVSPVVWVSAVLLSLVVVASAQPAGGHGVLLPNWLTAPLPPLEPGLYTVRWRVLTVDGHLNRGSFSFRVAERR